ncbi:MAG: zinc ribbon domain-containing protein [Thermoplasmata archaeon]
MFIEYKAEDTGKIVVYVNTKHTSQKCSSCGYINKNNRHCSAFRCGNCCFEFKANRMPQGTSKYSLYMSIKCHSQPNVAV